MSNFALGGGLEGFNSFMDVEAEATVKINAADDDASTDVAETAAPAVEDEIATTEKSDEDIDTAADNVNQTMNYIFNLFDEYSQYTTLYHVTKKYGMSEGLYDYVNMTMNYENRCKAAGIINVGGTEANAAPGPNSKYEYSKGFDTAGNKLSNAAGNAKDMAKRAWDKIVAMAKRFIEFVKGLFRKIKQYVQGHHRKLVEMQKKLEGCKNVLSDINQESLANLNFASKSQCVNFFKVFDVIASQANDISKLAEMDAYKQVIGNLSPRDKAEAFIKNYKNKSAVLEVVNGAEKAAAQIDRLDAIEKTIERNVMQKVQESKNAENNFDSAQLKKTADDLTAIQANIRNIFAKLPLWFNEAVRIGNAYIQADSYTRQETPEQAKANKEFGDAMHLRSPGMRANIKYA